MNNRCLPAVDMTAKQKGRKKRLAAASPPLNVPFSHTQRVMSTAGRHLLQPLQVTNFTCLSPPACYQLHVP